MSLNIKVNHVRKSKVFHAGDQISGVVTANGPINESATVVEIKFKGKSQTLIKISNGQTTAHYSDKVKFFRTVKIIHRGPCTLDRNSSTCWPFTFHLPLLTEPDHGNPDITYSKDLRTPYAKAPHPLPPSISVSGSKKGAKYKATISYDLHASLQRSGFLSASLKKSGTLPVVQCRPPLTSNDQNPQDSQTTTLRQTFTRATSRLLPEHAGKSRSLREWASDTFTSKAPRACFALSARSPTSVVQGQGVIPPELCMVYDEEKSTALTPPEVRLRSAHYVVKEHTHVRGRAMLSSDVKAKPSRVVVERKWSFDGVRDLAPVMVSAGWVELGGGAGGKSLVLPEGGLVPTFCSYAVCRKYSAKLTVRVSCGEKVFVATFRWMEVVVLAKEVEVGEEDGDGDEDAKELGKAESISVLSVGDAVEIGGQIVNGVVGVLGALG